MARERSIVVRLRAEVADFKRQMADAANSTEQVGRKAQSAGLTAQTSMGRLVQSARQNREAWTTAGTALAGVGVAMVGLTTLVARTGIEYNTLQQTSRAAMTTLLGGAEAANAQMDKLDEFARSSPFAKQVFIQAQQQLIGFGMAADDVLPTLGAIQDAVAATGGSGQDIAELTRIIAQVGAQGKITAVDLMQFGQRGVDAATLIGTQMGMTGAQIREEITNGTLGADEAIRALVAGMDERFGGAAANVKDTMAGAADRVKAAFRDISSSFASALVDPNGGGLLVDGFNRLADAMRAFEDIPGPIRNTALAMGGLTGVASLVAGSFLVMAPRIVETQDAFRTLAVSHPRVTSALGGTARLVARGGGLLLGLGALATILQNIEQSSWKAAPGLNEVKLAMSGLTDETPEVARLDALLSEMDILTNGTIYRESIDTVGEAFDRLVNPTVIQRLEDLDKILPGVQTSGDRAAEFIGRIDQILADMVRNGNAEEAGRQLNLMLEGSSTTGEQAREVLNEYRDALAEVEVQSSDTAGAAAELTPELQAQKDAAEAAAQAYAEYLGELAGSSAAFVSFGDALANVRAATQEWAQQQADATSSADDSWEDFYDGQSVKVDEWIAELERMAQAQQDWETNMLILSGRVSQGVLDELARLGPEGAPLVAELVDASESELDALEDVFARSGQDATGAWAEQLAGSGGDVVRAASRQLGDDAAREIAERIAAGEITAQQAVSEYDLVMGIDADLSDADYKLATMAVKVANTSAAIGIQGDAKSANQTLTDFLYRGDTSTTTPDIAADRARANAELSAFIGLGDTSTTTPDIAADRARANAELSAFIGLGDRSTTTPDIDGNDSPARSALAGFIWDADRSGASVKLSADASSAYATLWAFTRSASTSVAIGLTGGHAYGGHTGPGSKFQPAGIVHADEFVHTKENVNRPGMLQFHTDLWRTDDLDAAYAAYKARGFAFGGPVTSAPRAARFAAPVGVSSHIPDVFRLSRPDLDYLASRIGDRFESGLTTAARVERRVGRTFEAGRRRV